MRQTIEKQTGPMTVVKTAKKEETATAQGYRQHHVEGSIQIERTVT